MSIFDWRLTNKKPIIESEEIKELHEALDNEREHREAQEKALKKEAEEAKKELHRVKKEEAKRIEAAKRSNRKAAISHLVAAERYENALGKAQGARKSQLQAIIDERVEKFENLGFKLNGSITKTIQGLS
jgi:DNA-directed RNA polymerase alpha subunit